MNFLRHTFKLTSLFLFFTGSIEAQIPIEALPANLPHNESWFVSNIPVPENLKTLCETDSGRLKIIQNLDSLTLMDLKYQWMGAKLQNEVVPDSFSVFMQQEIQKRCGTQSGYLFNIQPPYNYFYYTGAPGQQKSIYCWNASDGGHEEDCNLVAVLELPKGWQACRLLYDIRQRRHGRLEVTPTLWLKNDNQSPPRFRGYQLRITGHGDRENISYVYLTNVRILAFKDNLDNSERIRCNCDLPSPPTKTIPAQPNNTSVQPAIMNGFVANKAGKKADLFINNTGGSKGRMLYRIDYIDGDNGQQKIYTEGYADLMPNATYHEELFRPWANDWKVIYMKQVDIPK